ncbi:MAG: glycine--tRNA ligase, partial [Rhodothermales bacterium]|nr:glycine--tRNA ligase [Rhodothermales bacterium]
VRERWWASMVQHHDNVVGLDAAILMHPKVWKASGHVDAFNDPMIDDKQSKRRYRADQLIENHILRLQNKGKGDRAAAVQVKLEEALHADDMAAGLHEIIQSEEIRSPDSGAFDWTEVRQFNLMFSTQIGPIENPENEIFLRPETAQGIFVNFHNVRESSRLQVPFGIAQIGKAFRNEIVARQFVFRMREFEQMEMQFFVAPGKQMEAYEFWRESRLNWHLSNGIRKERLRWHDHVKLAHYADAAVDLTYEFPMGWQEVEGIHSRTDFDLRRHQEFSGKKMEYFDPVANEKYIPFVVETSVGLDRTILMLIADAFNEEEVGGEKRSVLKFHPSIAPTTVALFPLVKKHGMPERARALQTDLQKRFNTFYDEKGAIGRRYRRMDEIGTPFCVTVDGDTETDNSVTIRERDTMLQERVGVDKVGDWIADRIAAWKPGI